MLHVHSLKSKTAILQQVSIFTHANDLALAAIANNLIEVHYDKGDVVFVKGEDGDAMFIIAAGRVKVHDGLHVFTELEQGGYFGELSLIDGSERTASITALEDAVLLKLSRNDFYAMMTDQPDILNAVFRSLIHRVRDKDSLEAELAQKHEEIRQKRDEIEAQRDEIEAQRNQIAIQNQDMRDSLQYASRIQNALLPSRDDLHKAFGADSFIMYEPRDIVSGDFYWLQVLGDIVVFVAADCTGHGVPGALMSMLGISFLNEIVPLQQDLKANCMLDQLRRKVKETLHQKQGRSFPADGMDLACVILNKVTGSLQFAGANNPLYLVRNGELIEYKADKMPIGIYIKDGIPFTNHVVQTQPNDCLYVFSDGFADQFGGDNNRKFLSRRFKLLLQEISTLPMLQQHQKLVIEHENWKGENEQVDDLLVAGFRL